MSPARGLNFTLTRALGDINLVGEIAGGGGCSLNVKRLIQVKRAAGRPKDLESIAELEAIDEARGGF